MIELSRIREAKRQIRLQAWTDMYREFLASGKTIKAWCEKNGIARTTFHNRLKRIREIVERHFGIMEILPEKEMFSVNILIPLHQGEQQT